VNACWRVKLFGRKGTLRKKEAVLDQELVADKGERGEEDRGEILFNSVQERREGTEEMKSTASDELFAEDPQFTINDSVGRVRGGGGGAGGRRGSDRRVRVLNNRKGKDGGGSGGWV
jgi:hypothetical protein